MHEEWKQHEFIGGEVKGNIRAHKHNTKYQLIHTFNLRSNSIKPILYRAFVEGVIGEICIIAPERIHHQILEGNNQWTGCLASLTDKEKTVSSHVSK